MTRCFVLSDEERRTITTRDTPAAALKAARRVARRQRGRKVIIWLAQHHPRHGALLPEPFQFVRVVVYRHNNR